MVRENDNIICCSFYELQQDIYSIRKKALFLT